MFNKTFYLALSGFLVMLVFLFFYFTQIQEDDLIGYLKLKELTQVGSGELKSRQEKKLVRKEIWTPYKEMRLHTRILSDTSKMTLVRTGQKNELHEEMFGVIALMQEELEKDAQIVRKLLAQKATYDFKNEKLIAEKVKLFRYRLPGNALPESIEGVKPLMEGEATWAEIYLKEGKVDLNASNVTLSSEEKEVAAASSSLLFDGRLAQLAGEVQVSHPMGKATSDKGEILWQNKILSEITLTDNVNVLCPDGSTLDCQKALVSFVDGQAHQVVLQKDVVMRHFKKGKLTTDKDVIVSLLQKKVTCEGPAIITHEEHTIEVPGPIEVDHDAKKTTLHASSDKQLHYHDSFGEIFSDLAWIDYDEHAKVKKITMEGKVFLAHSLPSQIERSYAYADHAEYFPETLVMILEGDRVLIYDKINQVEVSAPKITVKRNEVTKKEMIQGSGDVRLTLEEKEFQALKARFKLEDRQ